MANPTWPAALPYQPMKNAMVLSPPKVRARSDMDDGTARVRRRFRTAPWAMPQQWIWTANQFELFKTFYAVTLDEGAAWVDVPVFHGNAYATAALRFVEEPTAKMKGGWWIVDAKVEIDGFKVLTKAEANAIFPGAIP